MKNLLKNIFIEDDEEIINLAFRTASEKARKTFVKGKRYELARERERVRIQVVGDKVSARLVKIVRSFPNLDELPEPYSSLLEIYIKKERLKKILASLMWASRKISDLKKLYLKKLKGVNKSYEARNIRKEFYGRVASILKKVGRDLRKLKELEELKKLPDFKDVPTVVLCGLPNVGKSSLLWRLTGSKPEIKPYPFTTKGLMIGYMKVDEIREVQVIDTPGLLDRPIERRNKIEKKAIVAIEKLGNLAIFIFDVSGVTPVKEQENLFKEIRRLFKGKKVLVVANKIDVADEEVERYVSEKYSPIKISCAKNDGIEKVKRAIINELWRQ